MYSYKNVQTVQASAMASIEITSAFWLQCPIGNTATLWFDLLLPAAPPPLYSECILAVVTQAITLKGQATPYHYTPHET